MVYINKNIDVDYLPVDNLKRSNRRYNAKNNNFNGLRLFLTAFILTIVLSLITIIFLLKIAYKNRLYFNTTINNIAMGNMTTEEVYNLLSKDVNNYQLKVIDKDNNEVILTKEDIGLSISRKKVDETISEIISNQKLLNLLSPNEYEVDGFNSIDRYKLISFVYETDIFNPEIIVKPQNAYIKFDEDMNCFVIVPSEIGNELQPDFTDVLERMLIHAETTINLLELDLYKHPEITEDNEILIHNLKLYNDYVPGNYIIDMDKAIENISASIYYDWLVPNYIEENNELKKINPQDPFTIDDDKLKTYMDYLYKTYNTFGSTREFTTASGKNIKITQGDYGWWLNYKDTRLLIKEALLSKNNHTLLYALYYQKAAERAEKDYGNSYVEIDLKSQSLWLFIDGKNILSSGIVSGRPSTGYATPPGIYSLTYKERNATLTGPGYSTPVSYWMPFNKDIGLHDATWQPSFGGDRYLTNGSHGCINLPYEIAKKIYSYIDNEFPIILY